MNKINRREFLNGSAKATLAVGVPVQLARNLSGMLEKSSRRVEAGDAVSAETAETVLSGTTPLTMEGVWLPRWWTEFTSSC